MGCNFCIVLLTIGVLKMSKNTNAVKRRNQIAVGSGLTLVSLPAFSAVDVAVTTALTTAATDVGTVGAAVFAVLVAAAAFRYLKRVL